MIGNRTLVPLGAAMALLVGCTQTPTGLRKGAELLPTIGQAALGGQRVVPRQVVLRMAIVERAIDEPALGEPLWQVADSQVLDDATRRSLEANGMRMGLVTGELPAEVKGVFDAPPPREVKPATVILPESDTTLLDLQAHETELNLLMAVNERSTVEGKRFADVNGFLRISGRQDPEGAVSLRVVPELHHGPVRQGWGVAPGGGTFAPQQFVVHNGQAEETYPDMGVEVRLRPGQVAVLGVLPGRKGTLGHFLLTASEPNSDRLVQKVVFLWAGHFVPGKDGAPATGRDLESPATPPALEPVDPPEMPVSSRADATSTPIRRREGSPRLAMSR